MPVLLGHLWLTARVLLPDVGLRVRLGGLVLVGAAIPLTDLLVMKVFTDAVLSLRGSTTAITAVGLPFVVFAILFVLTRIALYVQRMYRVTLFTRAFERAGETPGSAQGWRWALALEMVAILTGITQVAATAAFLALLAPAFAVVNVVVVIGLAQYVGFLYGRQVHVQRAYIAQGGTAAAVPASQRVRSRIVSAERAGLASSAATLIQMSLLLGMALGGVIAAGDTIVLCLGLRLQGSTLHGLSASSMRFARALAQARPGARCAGSRQPSLRGWAAVD